MATAIAKSIAKGQHKLGILNLADPDGAAKLASQVNACVSSPEDLQSADMVVFGFKPQNLGVALKQYSSFLMSETIVVSIMAGVKICDIEKGLTSGIKVIRVMPNLAASVGRGVCAYCGNDKVSEEDSFLFEELFSHMGTVLKADEKYMSVVTALSGSGPAYFYYLCDYMTEAGVKLGMDRKLAEELVRGTLSGSARLLECDSEVSFAEMLKRITSAKGTTEAALNIFYDENAGEVIIKACEAAYNRSEELSVEVAESL